MNETEGHQVTISYLNKTGESDRHKAEFESADNVILAFPLYTDAMPGIVKHFIEALAGVDGEGKKKLGFVVQSGFPEAVHCSFVEKYLEKLAQRWNCQYLGTILKGGVEGIQEMPPAMTKKLFTAFTQLGRIFGQTGGFDRAIIASLRKNYRFGWFILLILRVVKALGLLDMGWKKHLKKHNALDRAYDRPYA
jgi:NAD(P)H-dependent FMN reductase